MFSPFRQSLEVLRFINNTEYSTCPSNVIVEESINNGEIVERSIIFNNQEDIAPDSQEVSYESIYNLKKTNDRRYDGTFKLIYCALKGRVVFLRINNECIECRIYDDPRLDIILLYYHEDGELTSLNYNRDNDIIRTDIEDQSNILYTALSIITSDL